MSTAKILLLLKPFSLLICFVILSFEVFINPCAFVANHKFLFLSTAMSLILDLGKLSASVVLIIDLGSYFTMPAPVQSLNQKFHHWF